MAARVTPEYASIHPRLLERYRNAWSLLGMEPMPVDEQDLPEQAEQ
jgi:hypothetical protein